MVLEYLNGFLGSVSVVVMGRDKLVGHVVTFDGGFEHLRAFVVQDVLLGNDVGCVQVVDECLVGSYHLSRGAIFHGFHQNDVAVTFGKSHDVLIASERFLGEPARLVGIIFYGGFIS